MNLAGVEIILNMREKMEEMQRQIEEFVSRLNSELVSHVHSPEAPQMNSLIPVIQMIPAQTRRASAKDGGSSKRKA